MTIGGQKPCADGGALATDSAQLHSVLDAL